KVSYSVACGSAMLHRRRSCSLRVATMSDPVHLPHPGPERKSAPATASDGVPELQAGSVKPRFDPAAGPSTVGQPKFAPAETSSISSCVWSPASTTKQVPVVGWNVRPPGLRSPSAYTAVGDDWPLSVGLSLGTVPSELIRSTLPLSEVASCARAGCPPSPVAIQSFPSGPKRMRQTS